MYCPTRSSIEGFDRISPSQNACHRTLALNRQFAVATNSGPNALHPAWGIATPFQNGERHFRNHRSQTPWPPSRLQSSALSPQQDPTRYGPGHPREYLEGSHHALHRRGCPRTRECPRRMCSNVQVAPVLFRTELSGGRMAHSVERAFWTPAKFRAPPEPCRCNSRLLQRGSRQAPAPRMRSRRACLPPHQRE